jgi:predicted nucleic acid-binding protein
LNTFPFQAFPFPIFAFVMERGGTSPVAESSGKKPWTSRSLAQLQRILNSAKHGVEIFLRSPTICALVIVQLSKSGRENMDIVVDTSVIIATLLNEPSKPGIVTASTGCALIAPPVIAWEIGNVFSVMFKRKRIGLATAQKALRVFEAIPIRYVDVNFSHSLKLAHDFDLYVYDACFLDCAWRHDAPFVSLDSALLSAARKAGIEVREILP